MSVVAVEPSGGGFVGGGAMPGPSVAVGASDRPSPLVEGADLVGVFGFLYFADFFLNAVVEGDGPGWHGGPVQRSGDDGFSGVGGDGVR